MPILPIVSGRPVPVVVVASVCLLLLATASIMALNSLSLAGDGSFYLLRVLGTEHVFGPDARVLGNAVRQAPVLLAVRLGLTDTHLLAVLLGVGQLVVPAAVWSVALALSRAQSLAFSAVAITAGICAGTTWFFSVSENVLSIPLTVLVAVLLWQPQRWRWGHVALASAVSTVLVASYETAALTGSVLAVWATWRAASSRSRLERFGGAIVALLSSVSAIHGAAWMVAARGEANAQSLLLDMLTVNPWGLYVALASGFVLIYALTRRADGRLRWISYAAGALGAAVTTVRLVMTSHNVFEASFDAYAARGGAVLAAFVLELFLFVLWSRSRSPASVPVSSEAPVGHGDRRWPLLVPVLFVAAMVFADVQALGRWSTSLDDFRAEVDTAVGVVSIDDALPPDRQQAVWGWTGSSLSLIVRGNASAGVLVNTRPTYDPFPPSSAREQLADKYTWRRSLR